MSTGHSLSHSLQQAQNFHPSLDFTHGHGSYSNFPQGAFDPSYNKEVEPQIVFCMEFFTDFCFNCMLPFFPPNSEVSFMYKSDHIATLENYSNVLYRLYSQALCLIKGHFLRQGFYEYPI